MSAFDVARKLQAACAVTRSFLGPHASFKCVIDDRSEARSCLAGTAQAFLLAADGDHTATTMLLEAMECQAPGSSDSPDSTGAPGSGATWLAVFCGLLLDHMLKLVEGQGVPYECVRSGTLEALAECCQAVRNCTLQLPLVSECWSEHELMSYYDAVSQLMHCGGGASGLKEPPVDESEQKEPLAFAALASSHHQFRQQKQRHEELQEQPLQEERSFAMSDNRAASLPVTSARCLSASPSPSRDPAAAAALDPGIEPGVTRARGLELPETPRTALLIAGEVAGGWASMEQRWATLPAAATNAAAAAVSQSCLSQQQPPPPSPRQPPSQPPPQHHQHRHSEGQRGAVPLHASGGLDCRSDGGGHEGVEDDEFGWLNETMAAKAWSADTVKAARVAAPGIGAVAPSGSAAAAEATSERAIFSMQLPQSRAAALREGRQRATLRCVVRRDTDYRGGAGAAGSAPDGTSDNNDDNDDGFGWFNAYDTGGTTVATTTAPAGSGPVANGGRSAAATYGNDSVHPCLGPSTLAQDRLLIQASRTASSSGSGGSTDDGSRDGDGDPSAASGGGPPGDKALHSGLGYLQVYDRFDGRHQWGVGSDVRADETALREMEEAAAWFFEEGGLEAERAARLQRRALGRFAASLDAMVAEASGHSAGGGGRDGNGGDGAPGRDIGEMEHGRQGRSIRHDDDARAVRDVGAGAVAEWGLPADSGVLQGGFQQPATEGLAEPAQMPLPLLPSAQAPLPQAAPRYHEAPLPGSPPRQTSLGIAHDQCQPAELDRSSTVAIRRTGGASTGASGGCGVDGMGVANGGVGSSSDPLARLISATALGLGHGRHFEMQLAAAAVLMLLRPLVRQLDATARTSAATVAPAKGGERATVVEDLAAYSERVRQAASAVRYDMCVMTVELVGRSTDGVAAVVRGVCVPLDNLSRDQAGLAADFFTPLLEAPTVSAGPGTAEVPPSHGCTTSDSGTMAVTRCPPTTAASSVTISAFPAPEATIHGNAVSGDVGAATITAVFFHGALRHDHAAYGPLAITDADNLAAATTASREAVFAGQILDSLKPYGVQLLLASGHVPDRVAAAVYDLSGGAVLALGGAGLRAVRAAAACCGVTVAASISFLEEKTVARRVLVQLVAGGLGVRDYRTGAGTHLKPGVMLRLSAADPGPGRHPTAGLDRKSRPSPDGIVDPEAASTATHCDAAVVGGTGQEAAANSHHDAQQQRQQQQSRHVQRVLSTQQQPPQLLQGQQGQRPRPPAGVNPGWVTVVLAHPLRSQLELQAAAFRTCFNRLVAALRQNEVLPGAGAWEVAVSEYLGQRAEQMERQSAGHKRPAAAAAGSVALAAEHRDLYTPLSYRAMASALRDVVGIVLQNGGASYGTALAAVAACSRVLREGDMPALRLLASGTEAVAAGRAASRTEALSGSGDGGAAQEAPRAAQSREGPGGMNAVGEARELATALAALLELRDAGAAATAVGSAGSYRTCRPGGVPSESASGGLVLDELWSREEGLRSACRLALLAASVDSVMVNR